MAAERLPTSKIEIYQRFRRDSFHAASLIREGATEYSNGVVEPARRACHLAFIAQNDSWSKFCRRLLIASALGLPGFTGSHPRAPGISDESAVLSALGIAVPWKDDRPWHVTDVLLSAARRLQVTNLATLNGSIGSTPNPSESVRRVRNFFAHANPDTYNKAYQHCQNKRPVEFCYTNYADGELICLNWFQELDVIARLACD